MIIPAVFLQPFQLKVLLDKDFSFLKIIKVNIFVDKNVNLDIHVNYMPKITYYYHHDIVFVDINNFVFMVSNF